MPAAPLTAADLANLLPDAPTPLLTLKLEALTPVFLGGSPMVYLGQGEAHLEGKIVLARAQASSARGQIRWWLRALLGGCVDANGAPLASQAVHALESSVLGTTEWSPRLRISLTTEDVPKEPNPEPPAQMQQFHATRAWARYWQSRGFYGNGAIFTVDVTSPLGSHVPDDPDHRRLSNALAAAVWCWATLGGLGTRTRHGFGALRLREISGPIADDYAAWRGATTAAAWRPPTAPGAWSDFLKLGLSWAGRATQLLATGSDAPAWLQRAPVADVPGWSCFRPGHWRAVVRKDAAKISKNWVDAMEMSETSLHACWSGYGPSETAAIAGAQAGGIINLPSLEFGLPRQYPSGQGTIWAQSRRASPLLCRPVVINEHQDGAREFGVIYLLFRAPVPRAQLRFPNRHPLNRQDVKAAVTSPLLPNLSAFVQSQGTTLGVLCDSKRDFSVPFL